MAQGFLSQLPVWGTMGPEEPHATSVTQSMTQPLVTMTQPPATGTQPQVTRTKTPATMTTTQPEVTDPRAPTQVHHVMQNPAPSSVNGPGMANEQFGQWLETNGLTLDTRNKLIHAGFVTKDTLKLVDLQDCATMDIQPLVQRKLVLKLVQDTSLSTTVANALQDPITASGSRAQPQDSINNKLAELFATLSPGQLPRKQGEPPGTTGLSYPVNERLDLNPLSYLLPRQKHKYLDITEFVQELGPEMSEEEVMGESDGGKIIFRTGPKKVKLENVTPMQWSAANMRILIELIRKGTMKDGDIFDYIAYTVKTSELAGTYLWQSILLFDRAYRQVQAQHGFRWGSDSLHLDAIHLKVRNQPQINPKGRQSVTTSKGSNFTTQGTREDNDQTCRLFQRNSCPYGDKCRYRHVCAAPSCGQNHPLAHHGNPVQHPKNM